MRRHLSYANVISTICLFALLGGGAYAATMLPHNSVGTKQIKNGKVKSVDVRDGTLLDEDFAAGQLLQGEQGTEGPAGEQGPPGPGADSVILRADTEGELVLTSNSTFADYPLEGASWTQGAGALQSIHGTATFSNPAGCNAGALQANFFLDGEPIANTVVSGFSAPGPTPSTSFSTDVLMYDTVDRDHTLTAEALGVCNGSGNPSITGVRVAVIEFR